jgi:hypothetical protein
MDGRAHRDHSDIAPLVWTDPTFCQALADNHESGETDEPRHFKQKSCAAASPGMLVSRRRADPPSVSYSKAKDSRATWPSPADL